MQVGPRVRWGCALGAAGRAMVPEVGWVWVVAAVVDMTIPLPGFDTSPMPGSPAVVYAAVGYRLGGVDGLSVLR